MTGRGFGLGFGVALASLVWGAGVAIADPQTLQCTNAGQPWATLTLDSDANTVMLELSDPNSVGPGNVSASGSYAAQINGQQTTFSLPFSAIYYNYTLDQGAGLLRQQVYDNAGNLLSDTDSIACS